MARPGAGAYKVLRIEVPEAGRAEEGRCATTPSASARSMAVNTVQEQRSTPVGLLAGLRPPSAALPLAKSGSAMLLSKSSSTDLSLKGTGSDRSTRWCCCQWHYPVIDPKTSRFLRCWDVVVAVLLAVTALLSPFESAFLHPCFDTFFVVDRCVDAMFLVDIVLHFFIAFAEPSRPTHFVRSPVRIVRHYLQSGFWIDLLSILPIDLFRVLTADGSSLHSLGSWDLRFLRVARLVRLLRLMRFSSIMERWHTSFGYNFATLSLVKFFVVVALCCHWMACLWGGLAVYDEGHRSWLEALQEAKGGPDVRYEGPHRVYLISLYWAIITLTSIGYGDITPQTDLEYGVAAVCTAMMAGVWAYVIGAVCGIVSTMEPHEVSFRRMMDDLNWIMRDRQVPQEMCVKLRRYFHETRELKRRRAEHEIMDHMSPQLQGEFAHFLHKGWIEKVWYFAKLTDEIIVRLSRHLEVEVFCPYEEVISDRTLFIVQKGIGAIKGKILTSGDVWGEDMLLSNSYLRGQHRARALSYLTVLKLHVEDVVEIVQAFPEARAKLRWAQVQIAFLRGIQKIAEVTRDLERRGSTDHVGFSEHERMEFYSDILNGRFGSDDENARADADYLGLVRKDGRRLLGQPSLNTVQSMNTDAGTLASGDCLARLSLQVEVLTENLHDLSSKVTTLVSNSRPAASPMRSTQSRNLGRSLSALSMDLDLGPVIVPSLRQHSPPRQPSPSRLQGAGAAERRRALRRNTSLSLASWDTRSSAGSYRHT